MDLCFQKQQATTWDKRTKPDSHVNNKYLSSQEKQEKMMLLKNAVKRTERWVETMNRLEKATENQGMSVDEQLHDDLLWVTQEKTRDIKET